MLRPSKKLLFAIEAVLDIAYNANEQPVQSRDITARQGIPRRYLEQVLQQLVRAGILVGVRGPRGGYRLARERRRISVAEISRVVTGNDANGDAMAAVTGSELGHKVVRPLWGELQEDLMDRLGNITIDELCQRARAAGIERQAAPGVDYVI